MLGSSGNRENPSIILSRMQLPNHQKAVIPRDKLTGYLLSETHPVGKTKARFFIEHGYTAEQPSVLERDLLAMARTIEVQETTESQYGTKYSLRGTLQAPRSTLITVVTVWITEPGDDRPRLVTAYPG